MQRVDDAPMFCAIDDAHCCDYYNHEGEFRPACHNIGAFIRQRKWCIALLSGTLTDTAVKRLISLLGLDIKALLRFDSLRASTARIVARYRQNVPHVDYKSLVEALRDGRTDILLVFCNTLYLMAQLVQFLIQCECV